MTPAPSGLVITVCKHCGKPIHYLRTQMRWIHEDDYYSCSHIYLSSHIEGSRPKYAEPEANE